MLHSAKTAAGSVAYAAASAIALVEAGRLLFLSRLPDALLVQNIPDDGFYYLQAARNFARLGKWTFDGTEPSSGFHLVWGYLLAFCFKLRPAATLHQLFVFSGIVQSFCLVIAAFLVIRTAERFSGARSAFGVLLVFLSAISLVQVSWMMETPFVILGAAVTVYLLVRTDLQPTKLLFVGAWILGIAVTLSRSDAGVPAALLLITHLYLWKRGASTRTMTYTTACVFAGVVAGIIVVTLHTHSVSGQWVQASAQEKVFWTSIVGKSFGAPVRMITDFFNPLYNFVSPFSTTERFFDRHLHSVRHHVYLEPFLVAGALIIGIFGGVVAHRRLGRPLVTNALLFVPALTILLYITLDRYVSAAMQPWYVGNFQVPAALLSGVGFAQILRHRVVVGASVLCLMYSVGIAGSFMPIAPWAEPMWRAGIMLHQHPELRPVGAWNAGIIAFIADRNVVNLDGLMNDTVVPFTRRGDLESYIAHRNLVYIVDSPQMWNENSSRLGGYSNGKLAHCASKNVDLFPNDPYNNFGGDTIRLYILDADCLKQSTP